MDYQLDNEHDVNGMTLYVCRANMGRSQVAAAFHNHYDPGGAESAGTQIDEILADKLEDWTGAMVVIEAMRQRGIDISKNTRRQITHYEAIRYGSVVVMAEMNSRPLFLLGIEQKVEWPVEDLKNKNLEEANVIIDEIDARVKQHLAES